METIETPNTPTQPEYAGFWLRLAAYIIDYFVLGFVIGTMVIFVGLAMGLSTAIFYDMEDTANQMVVITLSIIFGIVSFAASWLYYAALESGSYQGTLGKMVINLKVTDMEGERISFARASGRFFGKILSSFVIYIGYIMIGITEKKQGLHDILAGCLVVRK
jgi:uncharacterized RDD family membrane protein YckC